MYWTLPTDKLGPGAPPSVTLCEACALSATNKALGLLGEAGFDSMTQASVILEALVSINGRPGFGFTSSPEGACGDCSKVVA